MDVDYLNVGHSDQVNDVRNLDGIVQVQDVVEHTDDEGNDVAVVICYGAAATMDGYAAVVNLSQRDEPRLSLDNCGEIYSTQSSTCVMCRCDI